MVKHFFSYWVLILLLSILYSCSTEDNSPTPEPPSSYFVEVTNAIELNRVTLIQRLLGIGDNPIFDLPEENISVKAIRYHTVSPSGEPIEASGIITYPISGSFKGVVIGQHYSIGADREAPSSTMAIMESILALYGYVVISPDYLGFGSTVHLPQNYLHAESVGQITVDMVFAAREYMEKENMPIEKEMYIAGYSQGAFSSMAFAKMAQEKYPNEMPIRKVFAGGGPYDPVSMFDLFITSDELANPATVLLTIIGLDYSDQLNLNYSSVFIEPTLSNYEEWCVSKKYTLGDINRKLGSNKMEAFIHPDIYLPERNNEFNKLYNSLKNNRLTEWLPEFPVLLVHGKKDKTVPYTNSENAFAAFKEAGVDVQLIPTDLDHNESAILFYLNLFLQLKP